MHPNVIFIPIHNKAPFVTKALSTALAQQTTTPLTLYASDQGSTDGSDAIAQTLIDKYVGPHTAKFIRCTDLTYKGMAGLNNHFNWFHSNYDYELLLGFSADDFVEPTWAETIIRAFDNPSTLYAGTRFNFQQPDGTPIGMSGYSHFIEEEGLKDLLTELQNPCFGRISGAWRRAFFDTIHPLHTVESTDFIMPFMAAVRKGLYYIPTPLATYVWHASPDNTGTEGVVRAAEISGDNSALLKARETSSFHMAFHWHRAHTRMSEMGVLDTLPQAELELFINHLIQSTASWVLTRQDLTMSHIQPENMRV